MAKENKSGTELDERTPEQIVADAQAEANLIVEDAKTAATGIIEEANKVAASTKAMPAKKTVPLKPVPDYNMNEDDYKEHDLVLLKAAEGAKHHKTGEEIEAHGKPAEMLIQKGYATFVKVLARGIKIEAGGMRYAKKEVEKKPKK